ncbi:uncharacterized protein LOC115097643 [Rhinatrema bivittatum]|uniref:uncharacterized protein LOC115097643 n=1 Tax=Rhinatrema bivittatum TaxID=194408 RepID=UPI00112AE36D|nr:uncharacterized protein LOC115097643 [Rhinatrema bivittatum]
MEGPEGSGIGGGSPATKREERAAAAAPWHEEETPGAGARTAREIGASRLGLLRDGGGLAGCVRGIIITDNYLHVHSPGVSLLLVFMFPPIYSTDQSWEQENFTLTMRLPQTLLFSVLLCIAAVHSQTPVLSPAVLSVSLGQSATFTCDVGVKDEHFTHFLSQIPGEAPKLLLYHYHAWRAPKYGPGISSAHFTCTRNSAGTEYQLLIKNAEVTDTALYYCLKWYPSISANHCDKSPDKNPD